MNTTEKLAEISRIMADGYNFMTMRMVLEGMEHDPNQESAGLVLNAVDKFYRLCKHIERRGE